MIIRNARLSGVCRVDGEINVKAGSAGLCDIVIKDGLIDGIFPAGRSFLRAGPCLD